MRRNKKKKMKKTEKKEKKEKEEEEKKGKEKEKEKEKKEKEEKKKKEEEKTKKKTTTRRIYDIGRNFSIVMTRKRKGSCTNGQSGAVTVQTVPQRSNSLCLFHCCTQP